MAYTKQTWHDDPVQDTPVSAARLGVIENGIEATATVADAAVPKALYDANTVLTADSDNTPAALTVAEQRLLGRITGGSIDDLTVAQVKTLLAYASTDLSDTSGLLRHTLADAKGDLAVATAADTFARLAVGTIGQAHIADTNETSGTKWAFPRSLADTYLAPTGAYETMRRFHAQNTNTLVSGTVYLSAIALPKNFLVTSIALTSVGAATLPTHYWFSLCDSSFVALRSTADQTSTAWGALTEMKVALTSTYTTTTEGLFYIAVMQTATTPNTISGKSSQNSAIVAVTPRICLTGLTSQTTAPADGTNLAPSPVAGTFDLYAYVV